MQNKDRGMRGLGTIKTISTIKKSRRMDDTSSVFINLYVLMKKRDRYAQERNSLSKRLETVSTRINELDKHIDTLMETAKKERLASGGPEVEFNPDNILVQRISY